MLHGRHLLAATLTLAACVLARAGDPGAARALVDKAIAAQGGAANLAKYPASTAKMKGKVQVLRMSLDFTGEFAAQGADKQRIQIEASVLGEKFRLIHVLNRDKAWLKIDDETEEMDADDLAESKEQAYAEWVMTLTPLADRAFTLTAVADVEVAKKPARGVRVAQKGHRDVNLYFDKESSLLVRAEYRIKDDDGKDVTQETVLSGYKDVQGTKQATKIVIKRDGKLYMDGDVTDIVLSEKLDERLLAKP